MKSSRMLISIIFVLHIAFSTEECRIIVGEEDIAKYFCNSIQDLQSKSVWIDVLINTQNKSITELKNLKPKITITLQDKVKTKFTTNIINSITQVSSLLNSKMTLTSLTANTFANMEFKNIRFNQGQLLNIEPGTFSKMKNIQQIDITFNPLQRIQAGVFNNLPVETLILSNNKIMYIERYAFTGMKSLKNLFLDGNLLAEFKSQLYMHDSKELATLFLQNNSMTEIKRDYFKNFINLRVLNLSSNKIVGVTTDAFEDLTKLEVLNLAHNRIFELKAEIFPSYGFPVLSKLSIAYNRLSDLPLSVLDKLDGVKFISIGGNPWLCPCLSLVQLWINKNDIKQVCDDEYTKGMRPICVYDYSDSNTCTFSDTSFYNKYSAINKHISKTECTVI